MHCKTLKEGSRQDDGGEIEFWEVGFKSSKEDSRRNNCFCAYGIISFKSSKEDSRR